ncbi:MAG: HEAT repeat domain-containing protein [Bacillota bacterium]
MKVIIQQAKEIFADVQAWLSLFLQNSYAKWVIIGIIVAIILIIIFAIKKKRKKKLEKSMIAQKEESEINDNKQRIIPISEKIIEQALPLSDPSPKRHFNDCDKELPADNSNFAALSKKLKSHQGILSANLEAECSAAGADFLPELLLIYEDLDPQLAQSIKQLLFDEGWLNKYADALTDKNKNCEVLFKAWKYFPDARLLPALVDLLADKEEAVRMAGVWLLTAIKDKRSLPYLVAALLQPKKYLTARVGEVLVAFGMEAANLLARMLPEMKDEHKLIILEVLEQFDAGYQLMPLLECLNHRSWEIRAAAVKALGESNYYEAKEAVLPLTHDSVWQVRAAVAKALGQMKVQAAHDRLRQMLVDDSFLVRANAKEALDRLELEF